MYRAIILGAIFAVGTAQAQNAQQSSGPFDDVVLWFCLEDGETEATLVAWRERDGAIEGLGNLRNAEFRREDSLVTIRIPETRATFQIDTDTGTAGALWRGNPLGLECTDVTMEIRWVAEDLFRDQ